MNRIFETDNKSVMHIITVLILMLLAAASAPVSVYAADNPLKITLEQTVDASLLSAEAETAFKYRLKPLASENPMPPGSTKEGYTLTVSGNRSIEIAPLRYIRAGIYRYELFQLIETRQLGYTYDQRTYTLEVYVDAALNVALVVRNTDGTKANSIKFENKYRALPSDPSLMIDPPVKKTVSGNPSQNSVFTFNLIARDASYPMPSGSVGRLKTIQIIGSGENKFGTWSYEKEGVYYYTVHELNAGEKNYTYDMSVYTITDTVKDENGRLSVLRTITNDMNKQVTTLSFINNYNLGNSKAEIINTPKINAAPEIDGKPPYTVDSNNITTPNTESKPGPESPKTGDDTKTVIYFMLFILGCILSIAAMGYLLVCGKRRNH